MDCHKWPFGPKTDTSRLRLRRWQPRNYFNCKMHFLLYQCAFSGVLSIWTLSFVSWNIWIRHESTDCFNSSHCGVAIWRGRLRDSETEERAVCFTSMRSSYHLRLQIGTLIDTLTPQTCTPNVLCSTSLPADVDLWLMQLPSRRT